MLAELFYTQIFFDYKGVVAISFGRLENSNALFNISSEVSHALMLAICFFYYFQYV
ncbi:MAG: hypothetical protein QG670_2327 [Thermoproteota archaeon]|nr:hypothetical protein [Thermoproteota archaeon]